MRDRPSTLDRHRLIVHAQPNELVDHVDEDKANNRPANLRSMDRSQHTSMHNRHRPLSQLRRALRMVQERKKLY